jgi:hypothetical protein
VGPTSQAPSARRAARIAQEVRLPARSWFAVLRRPCLLSREVLAADELPGRVVEIESAFSGHLRRRGVGHEVPVAHRSGGGCAAAVCQSNLGRPGRCRSGDDGVAGTGGRLPLEDAVFGSQGRRTPTRAHGMLGSSLGFFDDDARTFSGGASDSDGFGDDLQGGRFRPGHGQPDGSDWIGGSYERNAVYCGPRPRVWQHASVGSRRVPPSCDRNGDTCGDDPRAYGASAGGPGVLLGRRNDQVGVGGDSSEYRQGGDS